ncbi:hypothetical protein [Bradyrhizobium sp. 193]|uniref:hypothetical protein n=1 Tax=Bradyrhizobium sp. 193 TaxID=2782661 RepID=UPI001FFB5AD5|nr:hypothetical protein [Bradyrhizobium sp. 193]
MPTVVSIVRSATGSKQLGATLPLIDLASAIIKQAPDGWLPCCAFKGHNIGYG